MTQQAFFDFVARPFQAAPQDGLFVPLEPMADAISQLCAAAVKGDGIGVLTAAPGSGKTVVCQQVQARLAGDFATVLLPSCRFPTRRAMLQSILHSMGCEYLGLSEQESLLKLLDAVQSVQPERQGLVLIADEAHQLGARLLEELRCLTNHVENGQPLIRVLLSGQLALEELLTQPELHSLNYRITCHTTLEPLSMQQSARYVDERLARVGGDACSLLGDDALEMICRISDGNPRCLNQLADSCLTHAAETGQRTVDARMVRLVLRDLKQLPLQWNESACDQVDEDDPAELVSPLSMAEDDIPAFDEDQTPPPVDDRDPMRDVLGEDRAVTAAPSPEPAWSSNVVAIEVGGEDDQSVEFGAGDDVNAAGGGPAAHDGSGPVGCDDGLRPETSDDRSPLEQFPAEFREEETGSIIDFGAAPGEALFGSAESESGETHWEEPGPEASDLEVFDLEAVVSGATVSGAVGGTNDEQSPLPSVEMTMPLASVGPSAAGCNVGGCGPVSLCPGSGQLEELDIFDRYAALDRNAEAANRLDETNGMALDRTDGVNRSAGIAGPEKKIPVSASSASRRPDAEGTDRSLQNAETDRDVPTDRGSSIGSPHGNIDRVIQAVSDAVATEIARDRGLSPAELADEQPHSREQQPEAFPSESQQADPNSSHWRATPDPSAFDVIEPDGSDRSDDAVGELPTPQNPTLSRPAITQPATSQPAMTAANPVVAAVDTGAVDVEPMVGLGEVPGDTDDATERLQQALDALLAERREESERTRSERRVDQADEVTTPRSGRERPYARLFSRARRARART